MTDDAPLFRTLPRQCRHRSPLPRDRPTHRGRKDSKQSFDPRRRSVRRTKTTRDNTGSNERYRASIIRQHTTVLWQGVPQRDQHRGNPESRCLPIALSGSCYLRIVGVDPPSYRTIAMRVLFHWFSGSIPGDCMGIML